MSLTTGWRYAGLHDDELMGVQKTMNTCQPRGTEKNRFSISAFGLIATWLIPIMGTQSRVMTVIIWEINSPCPSRLDEEMQAYMMMNPWASKGLWIPVNHAEPKKERFAISASTTRKTLLFPEPTLGASTSRQFGLVIQASLWIVQITFGPQPED